MNILMTGDAGFIGQNLAFYLVDCGHNVEGFDWKGPDVLPNPEKFDWVIHLGAISSTTETDVEKVLKQNYEFTMNLIQICDKFGVNMQIASSASVYGPGLDGYKEDSKCLPQSPYAWSKYLIDRWVNTFSDDFKINIQGFRYFNVYGNYEEHKGEQASPITKFTNQAKEYGVIKLFENSESYKRDFISVQDVCLVHEKMLEQDVSGIFNVGTGVATSFKEIAEVIAKKYNAKIELIPMPEKLKGQYQEYTCADNTKLLDVIDHSFIRPTEWIHESK